jgi:hypothetical protein
MQLDSYKQLKNYLETIKGKSSQKFAQHTVEEKYKKVYGKQFTCIHLSCMLDNYGLLNTEKKTHMGCLPTDLITQQQYTSVQNISPSVLLLRNIS